MPNSNSPFFFAARYIRLVTPSVKRLAYFEMLQEEVVNITMNKYRKAQQLLDEAERRADTAERHITIVRGGAPVGRHGGSRSMSVTREVTRVVRV
jgi:hypothetical protein